MRLCFDKEATNLLNSSSVDYTASPYKIKKDFKIHSAILIDVDTDIRYKFVEGEVYKYYKQFVLDNATELIGHNIIAYDLLVGKAVLGMDYKIGVRAGVKKDKFYNTMQDEICGKPITITDTLVLSKTLNPDRLMHSVEYYGKMLGEEKIDWRGEAIKLGLITPDAPKGAEFLIYHPKMLGYNEQDVVTNIKIWKYLLREWGDWNWNDAYRLEKEVAEIIVRQEHRGFWFDSEKAVEHVRDLDIKMEALRIVVEPLIPPKPIGKTAAKEYIPCKIQFKKNGEPSANILKWIKKHGGELIAVDGDECPDYTTWITTLYDKNYILPMVQEPIVTHVPAKINDTTHIKGWLKTLGWIPSAYKERDLTVDSKKHKLSKEAYIEACDRYIEQTMNSPFKNDRMEQLEVHSLEGFKSRLYRHEHTKRPLKVYTNPTLTVGMEKDIDPALLAMSDKFAHAQDVSDYLTYQHRRNSILGGGVDPDEDEEASKGWLSVDRIQQDHRIPTPADTCGAGTSRFKHRLVANVPRVTSKYGMQMRELFGVDVEEDFYQMGYDFSSLEAMMESHYCWKYDGIEKEYCKSLVLEKPNDVHCYDQETEILTPEGWKYFGKLKEDDKVAQWWSETENIEFVKPSEIVYQKYEGEMISCETQNLSFLVTPNHRQPFKTYRTLQSWRVEEAINLAKNSQSLIPTTGFMHGSVAYSKEFLTLLLAVESDGHFCLDCSAIQFCFIKTRKIQRLTKCLNAMQAKYVVSSYFRDGKEEVTIRLNAGVLSEQIRILLTPEKILPWSFLNLNLDLKRFIIEEIGVWDGTIRKHDGAMILDIRKAQTAEVIQALAITCGRQAKRNKYFKKTTYSSGFIERCYIGVSPQKTILSKRNCKTIQYRGMIGCVVVPSSFILVRRKGKVFVSGNTKTALKISEVLGREFKRTPSKSVKYCCAYGGQPSRVAKTIGCSLEDGKLVYTAYWLSAQPLAKLADNLKIYWETIGGKKFILGIDGRKIPTRSASALINSLFQSAGVICAKRAMVIHDRKLKEAGLSVDFWTDDWRNSVFVQQLIGYHDECQLEMHKSLIKWKLFKTEEEAKEFKKVNLGWSEIGHSAKGYYIGYCEAGRLIQEAVKETSAYYKLNVTLAADYILGRNWGECH